MTEVRAETDQVVHVTIDGAAVEARPGELIIEAAERAGVYVPRFCYHPRMEPVGMCRMCLVEVSSPRGFSLQPACYLRVTEGQEVLTESPKARKAQEGVIEFLLVNHPLDCPVCDKGGECPLQDQSLSHGPGESRFIEEKRHWAKPIEIGAFVALDRERCIQCARCTRFAAEIAGDAEIDFVGRSTEIEVAPFPTEPFDSYFSGNTVQICPVGALTARPYRFKARPWDLEQVETTCTTCSVGCRVAAQSSAGALVRFLGVDSEPVNQSWLCDKGRFSYEALAAPERLTSPALRRGESLVPVRWSEALNAAADALATAEGAVGVIGGAHLSNEDAYAWSRFARSVLRTDSLDAQLGDGLPATALLSLPRATIDEAAAARVVVLLTGDLREELPVLYLRLRAAAKKATTLVECSPVATALSPSALRVPYLPGEAVRLADALTSSAAPDHEVSAHLGAALDSARALLAAREGEVAGAGVVVVLGRANVAESGQTIADAAGLLAAALPAARFLPALRRSNVLGALDMGLAPGLLPGRRSLSAARAYYEDAWGALPASPGDDTAGMLRRAAAGELRALVLLGADPLRDFPDRELARRALERVGSVIALGTHRDASNALASVVLPVPADGERSGTTTNVEGRVTRLAAKAPPPGVAWAPWVVANELATRLGADLGFSSLEEITDEIAALVPSHAGLTAARLAAAGAQDGLLAPLAAGTPATAAPIDPMATPGITSVNALGAPIAVGATEPVGAVGEVPQTPSGAVPPALAAAPPAAPAVAGRLDSYSYRLVVTRRLYDLGTTTTASPALAAMVLPARLSVHPFELARLGLGSGDKLRLRGGKGEVVIEAVADERLPRSVVAAAGNVVASGDVLDLVGDGELATDVRLENL
ncbi:MAG TPA: NADH-quinone oxidoreductase subunit NuoG [Acidimicrobiales bacterium]|nr:NADH-quinone oxidoreductase subunit NuoG [Acidimicrobiales bacterium]